MNPWPLTCSTNKSRQNKVFRPESNASKQFTANGASVQEAMASPPISRRPKGVFEAKGVTKG